AGCDVVEPDVAVVGLPVDAGVNELAAVRRPGVAVDRAALRADLGNRAAGDVDQRQPRADAVDPALLGGDGCAVRRPARIRVVLDVAGEPAPRAARDIHYEDLLADVAPEAQAVDLVVDPAGDAHGRSGIFIP